MTKSVVKEKRAWIWLILIMIVGVVLRCYDPTFRSLWGDEVHSFFSAYQFPGIIGLARDAHLPVYFLLLAGWIKLFGTGEYGLRLLSIVIGSSAVFAMYYFAKRLFQEKTALLSAFLLAISPLAILYSQEVRMYGLLVLLAIGSAFYFWKIAGEGRAGIDYLFYFLVSLLLVYTHVYGLLLIMAQSVYLFYLVVKTRKRPPFGLIIGQAGLVLAVAPVLIKMLLFSHAMLVGTNPDTAFSIFPIYLKPFLYFFVLSLGETIAPWNLPVVLPAALVFSCLLLGGLRRWSDKRIVFLLIMTFMPIIIAALFLKPTMPKYLVICLPFYLTIISFTLAEISNKYWRVALILVLLMVESVPIANYYTFKEYHNSNLLEPWREISRTVAAQYRAGDAIIGSTRIVVYNVMNYYLNVGRSGHYRLFCLKNELHLFDPGNNYRIYGEYGPEGDVRKMPYSRIWFVTQIDDDRSFPEGYVAGVRSQLEKHYHQTAIRRYIPYEETLVAKLPIKRHQPGSSRIVVTLYEKNR